ncbi:MAG: hypothetical protein JWP66_632 [Naasia sp.]|nr:hypothetical protein [Naasia sp.]
MVNCVPGVGGGTPPAERLMPALHLVFVGLTGLAVPMVVVVAFLPAPTATEPLLGRRDWTL